MLFHFFTECSHMVDSHNFSFVFKKTEKWLIADSGPGKDYLQTKQ